jgi:hypothetical protein
MKSKFSVKSMTININGNIYEKSIQDNLYEFLDKFEDIEYKEITLDGNNGTSLLIEMNGNKSLCIFFEDSEKDIIYHSLNKNGEEDFYEEFIIPNGQKDIYEDIYLIENERIYEIIEYYYKNGTRSENILWEED